MLQRDNIKEQRSQLLKQQRNLEKQYLDVQIKLNLQKEKLLKLTNKLQNNEVINNIQLITKKQYSLKSKPQQNKNINKNIDDKQIEFTFNISNINLKNEIENNNENIVNNINSNENIENITSNNIENNIDKKEVVDNIEIQENLDTAIIVKNIATTEIKEDVVLNEIGYNFKLDKFKQYYEQQQNNKSVYIIEDIYNEVDAILDREYQQDVQDGFEIDVNSLETTLYKNSQASESQEASEAQEIQKEITKKSIKSKNKNDDEEDDNNFSQEVLNEFDLDIDDIFSKIDFSQNKLKDKYYSKNVFNFVNNFQKVKIVSHLKNKFFEDNNFFNKPLFNIESIIAVVNASLIDLKENDSDFKKVYNKIINSIDEQENNNYATELNNIEYTRDDIINAYDTEILSFAYQYILKNVFFKELKSLTQLKQDADLEIINTFNDFNKINEELWGEKWRVSTNKASSINFGIKEYYQEGYTLLKDHKNPNVSLFKFNKFSERLLNQNFNSDDELIKNIISNLHLLNRKLK